MAWIKRIAKEEPRSNLYELFLRGLVKGNKTSVKRSPKDLGQLEAFRDVFHAVPEDFLSRSVKYVCSAKNMR